MWIRERDKEGRKGGREEGLRLVVDKVDDDDDEEKGSVLPQDE